MRYHDIVSLDGEGEYLVQYVGNTHVFLRTSKSPLKVERSRVCLVQY